MLLFMAEILNQVDAFFWRNSWRGISSATGPRCSLKDVPDSQQDGNHIAFGNITTQAHQTSPGLSQLRSRRSAMDSCLYMSLWHFWTIWSPSCLHRGSVSFKKNVHVISQVGFFIATDKWQDQATKIHTSSTPYGTIQAFQQSSLLLFCGQKKYSTEGRWLSSKHIFPNVSQGWILTVYIFLYVNESTGFCPSTMC